MVASFVAYIGDMEFEGVWRHYRKDARGLQINGVNSSWDGLVAPIKNRADYYPPG